MTPSAVRRLQAHLVALYALEDDVDAEAFVVGTEAGAILRARLGRLPDDREALWILEEPDGLSLGLFLDDSLVGADVLADADLDRHCALLEGVSHLVYVLDRARRERPLSRLELELQAEVDKFVATWRLRHEASCPVSAAHLLGRLFRDCRIPPREDPDETARYRAAHRLGARYCAYLAANFLERGHTDRMWPELRRFWRMGHAEKIAHIEAR